MTTTTHEGGFGGHHPHRARKMAFGLTAGVAGVAAVAAGANTLINATHAPNNQPNNKGGGIGSEPTPSATKSVAPGETGVDFKGCGLLNGHIVTYGGRPTAFTDSRNTPRVVVEFDVVGYKGKKLGGPDVRSDSKGNLNQGDLAKLGGFNHGTIGTANLESVPGDDGQDPVKMIGVSAVTQVKNGIPTKFAMFPSLASSLDTRVETVGINGEDCGRGLDAHPIVFHYGAGGTLESVTSTEQAYTNPGQPAPTPTPGPEQQDRTGTPPGAINPTDLAHY